MNELIQSIFTNFEVDGVSIPVKFMRYNGKETTYVTYMETDLDTSYSGDNEILGYVSYYDFDSVVDEYDYIRPELHAQR